MLEASQSFLAMDAPRHTKLRGLVRAAFTPRQVARISDQIAAPRARDRRRRRAAGECDFVEAVAARLPMMTIWRHVRRCPSPSTERLTAAAERPRGLERPRGDGRPRAGGARCSRECVTLTAAALDLAEERRQHARRRPDDAPSCRRRSTASGSPKRRSAPSSSCSPSPATTPRGTRPATRCRRCATSPTSAQLLTDDLEGRIETAVEEFVRWATPVMTFRRTATRDTELRGQADRAGREGRDVLRARPTATRRRSSDPDASTSCAHRTATSASAAAGRTTAWARRSRGRSCARSSPSC